MSSVKRPRDGHGSRGFTLIELMIVVAIIGVLAAVAIPMFMDSIKKAKRSEVRLQLDAIAKIAKVHYATTGSFPESAGGWTPDVDCCTQNFNGKGQCEPVETDWNQPHWETLEFRISEPSYYQFEYTSGPGTFWATARGNLDCDGTFVYPYIQGTIGGSGVTLTRVNPAPNAD